MYVVLLANTVKEAMDYARARKLPRGGFRYASRASTIRGLRVAEVHILPGFAKRPDRFTIAAALRYTRSKTVEVSQAEYDQLLNAYPLEKALEIGFRYEAILEASRGEEARAPEPSEDAAPPAPPKRTAAKSKPQAEPAGIWA